MSRVWKTIASLAGEVSPLILFVVLNRLAGARAAVVGSTLWSLGWLALRFLRRRPVTTIFKFSAAMTLAFGAIDLFSRQPFMLKYEAVVTNLVTAGFFGASVFGKKSLIQDFYEKRPGARPMRPDLVAYFRGLTVVWTLYFVAKAATYGWIARHHDLERTLLIRAVIGAVSFYALLGVSIFGSPAIIRGLRRVGVMPPAPPEPAAAPAAPREG